MHNELSIKYQEVGVMKRLPATMMLLLEWHLHFRPFRRLESHESSRFSPPNRPIRWGSALHHRSPREIERKSRKDVSLRSLSCRKESSTHKFPAQWLLLYPHAGSRKHNFTVCCVTLDHTIIRDGEMESKVSFTTSSELTINIFNFWGWFNVG